MRWLRAAAFASLAFAAALVSSDPAVPTVIAAATPSETVVLETPVPRLPETTRETPSPAPVPVPAIETLRISIERLGIDLPLAYGDAARDVPSQGYAGNTPENMAFVFPGSAPLRSGGNTYVYAHARVGMFLSLWNVRVGDAVVIYSPKDTSVWFRYDVSEIHPRVAPSDTSWLDPSGPERLTLQTSTGPTPEDPRFIVIALPSPAARAVP